MKARAWYRFQNSVDDPSVVDIHIIDIIGDWIDELINEYYGVTATVTAKAFVDALAQLPSAVKTVKVHINSPGGDVFAAVNIANALRDQQTSKGRIVETIVDGLAASAASMIMMAGSKVSIADNAMVMVHNPWSVAMGNSADMRKAADTLDAIRNTIVATYKWHSELDNDAIIALLDAETWMDADEAIANGFATEKITGLKAAATLDAAALAKMTVPARFKAKVDALLKPAPVAPVAASALDVLTAVEAAGLDTAFAKALIAGALPMDQVAARIATAKDEKTQKDTRASEIRAACALVKQDELADGYIAGGMTLKAVNDHLLTITAKQDKADIDAGLKPTGESSQKSALNPSAIYADRNKTRS